MVYDDPKYDDSQYDDAPLSKEDCLYALGEYGAGELVWRRFWDYFKQQTDLGAPFEILLQSYENLEQQWLIFQQTGT